MLMMVAANDDEPFDRLTTPADVGTMTVTHYADYLAAVPAKRRVERRYERADTGQIVVSSLDDSGAENAASGSGPR